MTPYRDRSYLGQEIEFGNWRGLQSTDSRHILFTIPMEGFWNESKWFARYHFPSDWRKQYADPPSHDPAASCGAHLLNNLRISWGIPELLGAPKKKREPTHY